MPEDTAMYDEDKSLDPENEKNTFEYWNRWIKAAEKAANTHWQDSEAAWDEYEDKDRGANKDSTINAVESGSRIYWSSCKVIEPALYSKTPKVVTEREFGSNDLPALAACRIAEGLGKHHSGTSRVTNSRFDECMQSAVQEFMHADKAAVQIIYEKDTDAEGGVVEASQRIYPVSLSYNKTLHSPEAANQYDITEKAIYFFLSKTAAIKRFGEEKCKKIKWKSRAGSKSSTDEQTDTEDYLGHFVEGWECYDLENRMVRWYSDQCDEFLDEREDPDRYYDFWPTTDYIIGSKPRNSLFPTPVHTQLRPLLGQLHLLSERIYDLVDAIRPRALVDGDEGVVRALDSLDSSMFVACKDLQGIVEKGGLKNMVLFVPVRELVEALNTSIAIQQQFKVEFNESFGTPDVIRGITDPLEAEGTNQQNLTAVHDRFRNVKKQIATLASQALCKMIEISVQVYSPDKIARICGRDFWPDSLKPAFMDGLMLLKDPEQNVIRIDIDTDSLTFKDQRKEREEQRFVSDLITSGLQNIAGMLNVSPQAASISLKLLIDTLEKTVEGKYLTDEVKQAVNAFLQAAQQPKPPPPDYEMQKIEIEKARLQLDAQKGQSSDQIKVMGLEQKSVKTELDSVRLQLETVLEQNKQQFEARAEARRLMQEDARIQIEAQKFALEQVVQTFMMKIEAMTLEIKKMQAQVQTTETFMEEMRLAKEVDGNNAIGMIEAMKPPEQKTELISSQPPINLSVDMRSQKEK